MLYMFFIYMLCLFFIEIVLLNRDLEAKELLHELLLHDCTSNFVLDTAVYDILPTRPFLRSNF